MRLLLLLLSALFVPVSSRGWYFFGGDSGDGDTPFDPRQAAAGMSQQIVMSDSEKDEAMKANVDRSGHWRPQVHFSPPSNWLNDPNGLFLDSKGVWHMYYQYAEAVGGDIVKDWGHATSTDLLTWIDQPVAIPATARDGSIWSGSVVIDTNNTSALFPRKRAAHGDNVLAYYTSWQPTEQAQHMAFSHDGGYNFAQWAFNPIISLNRHGFRDPKVSFHHATNKWVMVLTFENSVTFYSSTNLRDWKHESVWDPQQGIGMIECPQLLQMPVRTGSGKQKGSKWVLVLSLAGGRSNGGSAVKYVVGDFDGKKFSPDKASRAELQKQEAELGRRSIFSHEADYVLHEIDFGPDKYATAFFHIDKNDANRDAISLSWATDSSYACCTPTDREGWRHCMTSARRHWIDADSGRMMSLPAADARKLISKRTGWNPIVSQTGVAGFEGSSSIARKYNPPMLWDLTVRMPRSLLRGNGTAMTQLAFQSSASGGTETVSMQFDFVASVGVSGGAAAPTARFSMSRAGLRGWDRGGIYGTSQNLAALDGPPSMSGEASKTVEFTLHGSMDRSIMEVYVNGGVEAGTMLYFAGEPMDSITLRRGAGDADKNIEFDFAVYALESIWGKKQGGQQEEEEAPREELMAGEL